MIASTGHSRVRIVKTAMVSRSPDGKAFIAALHWVESMEYRVSLEESEAESTLSITLDGDRAVLSFRKRDGEVEAIHTYTPSTHRGKGIAARLVEALIEYCRQKGLKIYPACPYVESYFEKRPDLRHMLSSRYSFHG